MSEKEKVTYGKVSPDVVKTIMENHVVKGEVVQDHVIPLQG
jgi:(2Fe-2S) ferredoxin